MGQIEYRQRWARKSDIFVNDKGQLYKIVYLNESDPTDDRILGYNQILAVRGMPGQMLPDFKCRYIIDESRIRKLEEE